MSEADIQSLIDLLKVDKLEEVVEYLVKAYPNDDNIIQLSGRLQKIRSLDIRGELSNDEKIRYRNKIRSDAFNLIQSVKEEKSDRKQPVQIYSLINAEIWFLPIVIVGVVMFFHFNFFSKCKLPNIQPIALPHEPTNQQTTNSTTNNVVNQTSTPYLDEKRIIGFDSRGRKAEYIIFIVRNFNWVLGETSMSERNGEQSEICEHLTSIGVGSRLNREDFKGIICFGNTSFEEDLSLPKSMRTSNEEDRAEFRAIFLSLCVSQVLKTKTPIFKSNLGKYKLRDEITDYQREIIIVGIVKNDENVIHEEALFNGLIDWHLLEGWEIDIREYSKVYQDRILIERYLN